MKTGRKKEVIKVNFKEVNANAEQLNSSSKSF
jgi:hypothetical protein